MDIRKLIIIALVVIGLFFVLYLALDWGGTENPIINNNNNGTAVVDDTNKVTINHNLEELKELRKEMYFEDGLCIDTSKLQGYEFSGSVNSGKLNASFNLYNSGSEVSKENAATISVEHIQNFDSIKLDVVNEKYVDTINEKAYYGLVANSDTYKYGYVLGKKYICITVTQMTYKNMTKEIADKIAEEVLNSVTEAEGTPIFDRVYELKIFDTERTLSKEDCSIDSIYNDSVIVEARNGYDIEIYFAKGKLLEGLNQTDKFGSGAYEYIQYSDNNEEPSYIYEFKKGDESAYYSVIGKCDTLNDFSDLMDIIYTK